MNYLELEESLENGLHDAELSVMNIDYVSRKITIDVELWLGSREKRELWRKAKLYISQFDFCIIDSPEDGYHFSNAEPLSIDAGAGVNTRNTISFPPTPKNHFIFWIYVSDWNSFIHISCRDIDLSWQGDTYERD